MRDKQIIAKLKADLTKIADPLKYLQDRLKEGESLNGTMALQLCDNATWLQQIAKDSLAELTQLESMPEKEEKLIVLTDIKLENVFKKVFINNKDDLPKESGMYECYFDDNTFGRATYDISDQYATTGVIWWINHVKWYLVVIDEIHSNNN